MSKKSQKKGEKQQMRGKMKVLTETFNFNNIVVEEYINTITCARHFLFFDPGLLGTTIVKWPKLLLFLFLKCTCNFLLVLIFYQLNVLKLYKSLKVKCICRGIENENQKDNSKRAENVGFTQ